MMLKPLRIALAAALVAGMACQDVLICAEFSYASSDTSVAIVSPSGLVRGVKPGLAHVLASWTSINTDHVIVVVAR